MFQEISASWKGIVEPFVETHDGKYSPLMKPERVNAIKSGKIDSDQN
jgi:hypothetical protein